MLPRKGYNKEIQYGCDMNVPFVQVSEQSDYDGWMEAWISCALHVRQRGVKGKVCFLLGGKLGSASGSEVGDKSTPGKYILCSKVNAAVD